MDVGTIETVVPGVVTAGESTAAALVAFELEVGDCACEFGYRVGVRIRTCIAMGLEGATVAGLCALPGLTLACVGFRIGSKDTHVIEVLVAMSRRFVVVMADAIACVWY